MRRGTIAPVTSRPTEAQQLRELAQLRRVRDRIDREYAEPLDVEALARGVNMSAGHLSRQFRLAWDGRDAVLRGETGDQTGQESRSAARERRLE